MKKNALSIFSTLFLFLFLCVSAPSLSREESSIRKSLDREPDPVVLIGKQLRPLIKTPIDKLALYRYRKGNFEPIPFQVDERNLWGKFVINVGEKIGTDWDKGLLDKNDELVFMARDLGDRAGENDWFHQYSACIEIEVTDPLTEGKGWAYLVAASSEAERSPFDYINFEFENDQSRIIMQFGSIGTDYSLNCTNHGSHRLGDEEFGPNFLDRIKFRTDCQLQEYLTGRSFSFNEEEFDIDFVGYRDGPVRVIHRIKHIIQILGFKVRVRQADTISYPYYIFNPNALSIPVTLNKIVSKFVQKAYIDTNRLAEGMRFFSDRNPRPVKVDGVMSPAEEQLDRSAPRWMGLSGPNGVYLLVAKFDPSYLEQVQASLYYMDDREVTDPPEEEQGQTPGFGYEFDLINLKRGTYHFDVCNFFLKEYHPGDEEVYLNVLEHPLQVTVDSIEINNTESEPDRLLPRLFRRERPTHEEGDKERESQNPEQYLEEEK